MSKKPRQNDPRAKVAATPNADGSRDGAKKPGPASSTESGPDLKPATSDVAKPRPAGRSASPRAESDKAVSGPEPLAPVFTPKRNPTPGTSAVVPGKSALPPEATDSETAAAPEPMPEEKGAQLSSEDEKSEATPKLRDAPAEHAVVDSTGAENLLGRAGGGLQPVPSVGPELAQDPSGEADPTDGAGELLPDAVAAAAADPGAGSAVPTAADAIVEKETEADSIDSAEVAVPAGATDTAEANEVSSPDSAAGGSEGGSAVVPGPAEEAVAASSSSAAGTPDAVMPPRPSGAAYMALAFVLEVALLGAVGLWAIGALPFTPILSIAIVAIPLIAFWGIFMSPQAKLRFRWPVQPIVAHLLFAAGTGLLFAAQQPVMGAVMGGLTLLSVVLTLAQRRSLLESGIITPRPPKPAGRRAAR